MSAAREDGNVASLRRLGASAVALLHTRLELFAIEVQEEKARVSALLVYALAALFFLGCGVLMLVFLLTVMLWDTHRLLPAAVFGAVFVALGLVAALGFARERRRGSQLFAASLAELAQDRETLEGRR